MLQSKSQSFFFGCYLQKFSIEPLANIPSVLSSVLGMGLVRELIELFPQITYVTEEAGLMERLVLYTTQISSYLLAELCF